jgi:hypothetical protein
MSATPKSFADGRATLVTGFIAIAEPRLTANTLVMLDHLTLAGTAGALYVGSRTPGVGFTVFSTNSADVSVVGYSLMELS